MTSKLNAANKDQAPEDNIFSKVLSGMKSVFNKPLKNKPKKSLSVDSAPPPETTQSTEATQPLPEIIKSDVPPHTLPTDQPDIVLKDGEINIGYLDEKEIPLGISEFVNPNANEENPETEEIPEYMLYTVDPDTLERNVEYISSVPDVAPDNPPSSTVINSEIYILKPSKEIAVEAGNVPVPAEDEKPTNVSLLASEKDTTTESVKHHKSKHTPKKKSRKKTKTRDSDERHESETEEATDASTKILLDKVSPVVEDTQNKPRIVLTFRSEKTGLRSTNMKIVSENEKANEESANSSRRSLRNKIVLTGFYSEENQRESRKLSSLLEKELSLESPVDEKSAKGANSESDDSAKTPPSSRQNKCNVSAAPSDSNSDDSPSKDSTIKRSARHRSKEHSDNILANAIARKEKFYNETSTAGTTRLSRRIKPTAKVLANRELRIGFETQNNARLALVSEAQPPPEEYTITRSRLKRSPEKNKISIMSAPKTSPHKAKKKPFEMHEKKLENEKCDEKQQKSLTVDEINRCILGSSPSELIIKCQRFEAETEYCNTEDNVPCVYTEEEKEKMRLHKLKKKHLKKLGLKAVTEGKRKRNETSDRDVVTDESTMDSTNTEAIVEHLNTRSKTFECSSPLHESVEKLEEPEDIILDVNMKECSDEDDLIPSEDEVIPKKDRKRKVSSDMEDSLPIVQLTKLSEKNSDAMKLPSVRMTRKRSRMESSVSLEQKSNVESRVDIGSTSADEGGDTTASQPEGSTTGQQSCLCNHPSNVYLDPNSLAEVEYCRAVDWVGGRALGCNREARGDAPLVRASLRAPFFLPCTMHRKRLELHHCCASCGAFCTQGVFYRCSEGHLFHWECGLPFTSVLMPPTQMDHLMSPPSTAQPAPAGTDQPSPQKLSNLSEVYSNSPGCPHCGLVEETMEPVNTECERIKVEMKCSTNNVLLPNPKLESAPARMSFPSKTDLKSTCPDERELASMIKELDVELPIVPADLLPQLAADVAASDKEKVLDYDEVLIKDPVGEKPVPDLQAAICNKENSVTSIMAALAAGADPRKPIPDADGGNCVHVAAREFNLPALHLFRSLGCALDALDAKRRTPLMVAVISYDSRTRPHGGHDADQSADKLKDECEKEFYATMRYLVKAGSDVTLKGPDGVTALHLAAKNSNVPVCSVLLESRNNTPKLLINQKDDGGWTPLVWAAENNNVHIVRFLLERGADSMIRDSENNVALHWSTVSGCSRSLEALLNAGSCVNVANIYGDTPLHVCARQNHYNCLVLLLARGAKVDMKNNNGHTPLDLIEDEQSVCHSILAVNMQLQHTLNTFGRVERIVSNDISNGKELYAVQCVNGVDDEDSFGDFTYITENCFTTDINIDRKITSMEGCLCTGRCGQSDAECACSTISIQSWYEPGGKLVPHFDYDDPPMIFECNDVCSCNKNQCLNRSLSRGPQAVLQVFRCVGGGRGGRGGWGVRAARRVQRGQLVACYVGRLGTACARRGDSYLFQLKDNTEDDGESYCIDAQQYGNVSRFINHKCSPNLVPVRVFTGHRDLNFPHIAFFACRDIETGEELGFDYGEKFWSVKRKSFNCQCGDADCRYAGDRIEEPELQEETLDPDTTEPSAEEAKTEEEDTQD